MMVTNNIEDTLSDGYFEPAVALLLDNFVHHSTSGDTSNGRVHLNHAAIMSQC